MKTEHYLGGLILLTAAALVLSQRPFLPVDMPRIMDVEVLPDGPRMQDVRRYTEYGSGILPYTPREQAERARRADHGYDGKIHLGYAYRELSFLRMPFFAYSEYGLVTYEETGMGYQIALMGPEQLKILQGLTGKDYSGYRFPFWWHLWGWLFVAGFAALPLIWMREDERRWRREAGIE
jgi:hypothetical protein